MWSGECLPFMQPLGRASATATWLCPRGTKLSIAHMSQSKVQYTSFPCVHSKVKGNTFPILIFHLLLLLYLPIAFGLISALSTDPAAPNATASLLALPARNGQNLSAKTKQLLQNMGLSFFYLLSALQVFKDYTWKL